MAAPNNVTPITPAPKPAPKPAKGGGFSFLTFVVGAVAGGVALHYLGKLRAGDVKPTVRERATMMMPPMMPAMGMGMPMYQPMPMGYPVPVGVPTAAEYVEDDSELEDEA